MGASEILQVLQKGDKLTKSEIAQRLNSPICAVQFGVRRLLKDVSEKLEFRALTSEEKELRFGKKVGSKITIYWLDG